MPIIDVRPVVRTVGSLPTELTQTLADATAVVLNAAAGRLWIRLTEIPRSGYAENGPALADHELPVFVTVLHAEWPDAIGRAVEARALSEVVAACFACAVERVHVEYAPPGRGRVAFGGTLVE